MLEAIADIRARLDDLEYQAVQWAREQGETWDQIGERLGISRQAAQSPLAPGAAAPAVVP